MPDEPVKLGENSSTEAHHGLRATDPVEPGDEGPEPDVELDAADTLALGLDDEPIDLTTLRRRHPPDEEEIKAHIGVVFMDYWDRLVRVAARRRPRRQEAEDLVSRAFLKVVESPEKVAHLNPRMTAGFVATAIVNLCRDDAKKDERRKTDPADPQVLDNQVSRDDPYERTIARQSAVELLRLLPRVQAQCMLAKCQGLNMRRAAELIGVSHENAR